jgi:hypothetical protein
MVLRDASGKRLPVPEEQALGIDGVVPTPKSAKSDPIRDIYSLPNESRH